MPAAPGDQTGRTSAYPNAKYTVLQAPGPLPLDMIRAVPAIRRDPLAFLERCVAQHGDLVAFPMPRAAVLLVNDPDGARRVLQDNHRGYSKQTVQYGSLSMVTGSGLLTADGEPWRRHRRLVQPAFHHGALPGVARGAVDAAELLRRQWDAAPDQVLDADAATMRAMLEVVGHTLFAQDLAQVGARVVAAVDDALHVVVSRAQSPLPGWLPTPSRARLRRAVATIDEVCLDVVRRRRAAPTATMSPGPSDCVGNGPVDVLSLLLDLAPDGLTDREVRDELVTLIIAGHETVASSLTWTLHLLSRHPGVQDRLTAELDAVLAGRAPCWEDLAALTYTRAVVDEALRLYPPAWVVTRRALEPDVISGVAVPAGTLVILSPWLLHRRAASWPRPTAFDPARFADQSRTTAPRGDYVPFGAGPRLCIGRDFALVEAALVLAALLRDRRVESVSGAEPTVDALVTLRPRDGLPLRLLPRR